MSAGRRGGSTRVSIIQCVLAGWDPPWVNIVSAILYKQDSEVLTVCKMLCKVVEYKAGKEREGPSWSPYCLPKTPGAGHSDRTHRSLRALKELTIWEVRSRITVWLLQQ